MFLAKVVEKIKIQILCSIFFFYNHAFHELMWEITVEPDRPQMTIWRMRIACWVSNVANTHSQYVIIIYFPLQQYFHESVSMLRYTEIT